MALGAILGTALGGLFSAGASRSAARAQAASAAADRRNQREMYDQTREDLAPYREFGNAFMPILQYEMGAGEMPEGYGGFTGTPGYDFRRQQGLDAIEASAAARGMLRSAGTMAAQQEYGDGLASAEYGNHLARLFQGAGMGQSAAAGQAAANQNFANMASNTYAAQGNAQAAGIMGTANAFNNTANNLTGLWAYQNSRGNNFWGNPIAS